jgi:hypothetical protein
MSSPNDWRNMLTSISVSEGIPAQHLSQSHLQRLIAIWDAWRRTYERDKLRVRKRSYSVTMTGNFRD